MARAFLPGGTLASLMGIAFIVPVIFERMETGTLTGLGIGFVAAGCGLIACGLVALVAGFRRRPTGMPSSVRAAVAANLLFLAFLALELSDRSVRQDGKLFYWTTFLFPPLLSFIVGVAQSNGCETPPHGLAPWERKIVWLEGRPCRVPVLLRPALRSLAGGRWRWSG